jgi:hypothetical protein
MHLIRGHQINEAKTERTEKKIQESFIIIENFTSFESKMDRFSRQDAFNIKVTN